MLALWSEKEPLSYKFNSNVDSLRRLVPAKVQESSRRLLYICNLCVSGYLKGGADVCICILLPFVRSSYADSLLDVCLCVDSGHEHSRYGILEDKIHGARWMSREHSSARLSESSSPRTTGVTHNYVYFINYCYLLGKTESWGVKFFDVSFLILKASSGRVERSDVNFRLQQAVDPFELTLCLTHHIYLSYQISFSKVCLSNSQL